MDYCQKQMGFFNVIYGSVVLGERNYIYRLVLLLYYRCYERAVAADRTI